MCTRWSAADLVAERVELGRECVKVVERNTLEVLDELIAEHLRLVLGVGLDHSLPTRARTRTGQSAGALEAEDGQVNEPLLVANSGETWLFDLGTRRGRCGGRELQPKRDERISQRTHTQ